VRQWVLTLPPRVRYLLAWDHALCRAVVAVFLRAVGGWLRARARRRGVGGGRWGAVAIVQRFGSALNLNVHIHALVLDGVYACEAAGRVRFWSDRGTSPDLARLLAQIQRRVERLLARRGHSVDTVTDDRSDAWTEDAPVLAGLAAASVQGVAATGGRAGQSVRRWGDAIDCPAVAAPSAWHAHANGFDLHVGQRVPAKARERLERLCRYALRPAVGQTRLQAMPDGTVVLELSRRWRDGTTHLIFEPIELLERLAVLVPRPRVNLLLYHGVLAPRAAWRRAVVPTAPDRPTTVAGAGGAEGDVARMARAPNRTWADLMRRGFGFDVLACPRCGGRLRLVALIHAPPVIARILGHLHLPVEVPVPVPARAPPDRAKADCLAMMAE
jgi:hypothetical protein